MSEKIIIKTINVIFISQWRVSVVAGGFVKQVFKNNGLIYYIINVETKFSPYFENILSFCEFYNIY